MSVHIADVMGLLPSLNHPSQLAGELRFAIELKFAEAGLKVLPAA